MEEYITVAATNLTATENNLYTDSKGAIIKTILLNNTNQTTTAATLTFDGVAFNFKLEPGSTVIGGPILTKKLSGVGHGVNIHVTGLQLV